MREFFFLKEKREHPEAKRLKHDHTFDFYIDDFDQTLQSQYNNNLELLTRKIYKTQKKTVLFCDDFYLISILKDYLASLEILSEDKKQLELLFQLYFYKARGKKVTQTSNSFSLDFSLFKFSSSPLYLKILYYYPRDLKKLYSLDVSEQISTAWIGYVKFMARDILRSGYLLNSVSKSNETPTIDELNAFLLKDPNLNWLVDKDFEFKSRQEICETYSSKVFIKLFALYEAYQAAGFRSKNIYPHDKVFLTLTEMFYSKETIKIDDLLIYKYPLIFFKHTNHLFLLSYALSKVAIEAQFKNK
ncbi:MAG: hypothetical protein CME65_02385 [Halobacteriovoraceae bacterium]|nr:hypothetical protein [Halobacteriovoraceae bacterium]|tara:strand:- start:11100 stop:12005 length:906 start_codon:yes stop_codon:yes gene_type:complete